MTQNKYFEKSLPISIQIFQKISIFISFSEFHSKIWKKVYQKRSETPRFFIYENPFISKSSPSKTMLYTYNLDQIYKRRRRRKVFAHWMIYKLINLLVGLSECNDIRKMLNNYTSKVPSRAANSWKLKGPYNM